MKKLYLFGLIACLVVSAYGANEVREYTCNKVQGTAPVIDGNFTEDEWAGSEWTGDFHGLRNSGNAAEWQGTVIEEKWQWRALWDDDYLYLLMTADLYYINKNGWTWAGGMGATEPLAADDTGYAGWGFGTNLDFEFFLSPNWSDELTGYPNEVGNNPPGYQLCYFPLLEDSEGSTVYGESNFGIRNQVEGPPYFHTGTVGTASLGAWNPIYDSAGATAAGVKPFILAAQPHLIDGAVEGTDIVGTPVLEVAIPYSQLSLVAVTDYTSIDDIDVLLVDLIMTPDANGKYVEAGDVWLVNVCGYDDGVIAEKKGLGYLTWNDMGDGGFHNAPRGKLNFAGGTAVSNWMLQ